MQRDPDGVDRWYIGERNCGTQGGAVMRKDYNKLLGRLAFPKLEQAHPGGHVIKDRLRALDDMGIYAQIAFQNSGGSFTIPANTTGINIQNYLSASWRYSS